MEENLNWGKIQNKLLSINQWCRWHP